MVVIRLLVAVAASLGLAIAFTASAGAAEVSIGGFSSEILLLADSDDEDNEFRVTVDGSAFRIEERQFPWNAEPISAGTGCFSISDSEATCPVSGILKVVVDLGEGNNWLDTRALALPIEVTTGTVFSYIETGSGSDTVTGGPGIDYVASGGGNDTLDLGDGDDWTIPGLGDDTVDGGSGLDKVDYDDHVEDVTVALGGSTGNGAALEDDSLVGLEMASDGQGDDQLTGTTGNDGLDADSGGEDSIDSLAGDDVIYALGESETSVDCGADADDVVGDSVDDLAVNCETTYTEPTTILSSGPAQYSTVSSVPISFTFSSPDGEEFECRPDDGTWVECDPGIAFPEVRNGGHYFCVRVIDGSEEPDPSPACRHFETQLPVAPVAPMSQDDKSTTSLSFPINDYEAIGVSLKTGSLRYVAHDFSPQHDQWDTSYDRFYNSSRDPGEEHGLGARWGLSVGPDVRIEEVNADSVVVHGPGGDEAPHKKWDESWVGPSGYLPGLEDATGGAYVLHRPTTKETLRFDSAGELVSQVNRQGEELPISTTTAGGREVLESFGQSWALVSPSLDVNNMIDAIELPNDHGTNEYTYDSAKLEAAATEGGESEYTYDVNGYLDSIEAVDGTTVAIVSSVGGKVESVTVDTPSEAAKTWEFAYTSTATSVTGPDEETRVYPFAEGEEPEDPAIHDSQVTDLVEEQSWSRADAEAFVGSAERSSGLADALSEALGSNYVALLHQSNGDLSVQLIDDAEATIVEDISESFGVDDKVSVTEVDNSDSSMRSAVDAIAEDLDALLGDNKVSIGIDDELNRVVVNVNSGELESGDQDAIDLAVGEFPGVAIQSIPDPDAWETEETSCEVGIQSISNINNARWSGCSSPMRGGIGLSVFGEGMGTAGFVARRNSDDLLGVMTAGHVVSGGTTQLGGNSIDMAVEAAQYDGAGTEPFGKSSSAGAWGSKTHPGGAVDVGFAYAYTKGWSTWATNARATIAVLSQRTQTHSENYTIEGTRLPPDIGAPVCIAGGRSGNGCGRVSSRYTKRNVGGTITSNAIAIDLDVCDTFAKGDSGSPVFFKHQAIGILNGTSSCTAVASPVVGSGDLGGQQVTDTTILLSEPTGARRSSAFAPSIEVDPFTDNEGINQLAVNVFGRGMQTFTYLDYGDEFDEVLYSVPWHPFGPSWAWSATTNTLFCPDDDLNVRVRAENFAGWSVSDWNAIEERYDLCGPT